HHDERDEEERDAKLASLLLGLSLSRHRNRQRRRRPSRGILLCGRTSIGIEAHVRCRRNRDASREAASTSRERDAPAFCWLLLRTELAKAGLGRATLTGGPWYTPYPCAPPLFVGAAVVSSLRSDCDRHESRDARRSRRRRCDARRGAAHAGAGGRRG